MAATDADEWTSRHEAYGTVEEVVAEAMIEAMPWTVIRVEDGEGRCFTYLVSHWLEA